MIFNNSTINVFKHIRINGEVWEITSNFNGYITNSDHVLYTDIFKEMSLIDKLANTKASLNLTAENYLNKLNKF